jgi:hypothetical protein
VLRIRYRIDPARLIVADVCTDLLGLWIELANGDAERRGASKTRVPAASKVKF